LILVDGVRLVEVDVFQVVLAGQRLGDVVFGRVFQVDQRFADALARAFGKLECFFNLCFGDHLPLDENLSKLLA